MKKMKLMLLLVAGILFMSSSCQKKPVVCYECYLGLCGMGTYPPDAYIPKEICTNGEDEAAIEKRNMIEKEGYYCEVKK